MLGLIPFGYVKDLTGKQEPEFKNLFDVFNTPFFKECDCASDFGKDNFKVDVKDTGDGYELTADLPGMKKEDISLKYDNNYLVISANKNEEKNEQDEQGNYIRRERRYGSMSRSFYIDDIDESKVEAEFKDGVLKIDMPKMTPAVPESKQILIK